MMMVPCPWCGPRDAGEFRQAGEVIPRPDPASATPAQWRAYLYLRANSRGWATETWYHRMGCRGFITMQRHTETHEIRAAWPASTGPQAATESEADAESRAGRA
jgi:heterotetrameric sarcosine oxidase delta subunit